MAGKVEDAVINLCSALPVGTTVERVCKDINRNDADKARSHASGCHFDRLFDDLLRVGQNEGSFWRHVQELVNYRLIDEKRQDQLIKLKNDFNDALAEELVEILKEKCSCKF